MRPWRLTPLQGRKRVHNADELMAEIRSAPRGLDFLVMKTPLEIGAATLGRGYKR
jgi:hypothetical protein